MPALLLALAVLVTGFSVVAPSPAQAQQPSYRGWSLRDLFFPRREPRYYEPPAEGPAARPKARVKPKAARSYNDTGRRTNGGDGHSVSAKPRRVIPAEPATPVVEKQPDAKVVLVIGDFMGSGIAEGLAAVYAANPRVKVIDRTKGSSGFARDDYYDWPKQAGSLIEAEKPSVVVVMLGSNDRQQMRVGDTTETPRSESWDKEYDTRARALAKAITDRKVPFIWVGTPAFKFSKMTADMLAFNDIYRATAEASGAEFVDVWDGFVDENGTFVTMGPDVNGQPVRLRSDDGVNFTKAGKRKLAFYAEKPLNKILGVTNAPGAPASGPMAALPGPQQGPVKPVDRTPPISLNDPALDGGSELLGAQTDQKRGQPSTPGEKLMTQGVAPLPSPGRADDFLLPAAIPATATPATTPPVIAPAAIAPAATTTASKPASPDKAGTVTR